MGGYHNGGEQRPAQPVGIAMSGVGDPGADARHGLGHGLQLRQAPAGALHRARQQAAVRGPDAKAEKRNAFGDWVDARLAGMEQQAQ